MKGLFGIIIVVALLIAAYHYFAKPKLEKMKEEKEGSPADKALTKKFGFSQSNFEGE